MTTLLLAEADLIERALRRHRRRASHRSVFVLTSTEILPFRAAGIVVEVMPSPEQVLRYASVGDWSIYLLERWRLLRSKWHPDWLIADGASFEDYYRACGFQMGLERR